MIQLLKRIFGWQRQIKVPKPQFSFVDLFGSQNIQIDRKAFFQNSMASRGNVFSLSPIINDHFTAAISDNRGFFILLFSSKTAAAKYSKLTSCGANVAGYSLREHKFFADSKSEFGSDYPHLLEILRANAEHHYKFLSKNERDRLTRTVIGFALDHPGDFDASYAIISCGAPVED